MLCCWLVPHATATEVRTQRGHKPQVLVCSQLELGPTSTAFIHFGQTDCFCFSSLAGVNVTNTALVVLQNTALAVGHAWDRGSCSSHIRVVLASFPSTESCWVMPILCLLGEFLDSFGCLGSQGWKCCLLWHWGDVEVNKEPAEGKGSGCRSPPGSVA